MNSAISTHDLTALASLADYLHLDRVPEDVLEHTAQVLRPREASPLPRFSVTTRSRPASYQGSLSASRYTRLRTSRIPGEIPHRRASRSVLARMHYSDLTQQTSSRTNSDARRKREAGAMYERLLAVEEVVDMADLREGYMSAERNLPAATPRRIQLSVRSLG
jgi:hypothetical protein